MLINEITGRELLRAPATPPKPGEPSDAGAMLLKIANTIDPDETNWDLPEPGVEAAVAVRRGGHAYKVFWADSEYTGFIRMVLADQENPHWPRISSYKPRFHKSQWSVVRMEPLAAVSEKELTQHHLNDICYLVWRAQNTGTKMHPATVSAAQSQVTDLPLVWKKIFGFIPVGIRMQTIKDAAQRASPTWRKAVEHLLRHARSTGHTFLDLHSGNFMKRTDGTLVITDPFVRFENPRK